MTPEQRKKLEDKGEYHCFGAPKELASKLSFMAGAEAGHAIRDEEVTSLKFEVERLRKANEVMRTSLKEHTNWINSSSRKALAEADKILGGGEE